MKEVLVRNCSECPGCIITDTDVACYPYMFINQMELGMDREMLEDIPEECPLKDGVIFKIDDSEDGEYEDVDE